MMQTALPDQSPAANREDGLIALDDELWLADGGIVDFYGFPYPTRVVVARLPSGALWVWSPIKLTDTLREQVSALGTPVHLVSPNALHHLYLAEWQREWPEARLWGPASTIRKRNDLTFAPPLADDPPGAWENTFDQAWFRGSLMLDEIVFFHRPSQTAIFADLSENFSDAFLKRHWSWWKRVVARLWGIVEGRGYAPLEWRLSWLNRKPAREALGKVFAWHPKRVVMAHGEWVEDAPDAYLKKAFSWLT